MVAGALVIDKTELLPLSIRGMKGETVTDFDLYIDVGGHIILYAPSPYRWSQGEIERLSSEGHNTLFYRKDAETKVSAYRRIGTLPEINESLPPHRRIQSITDVASEYTKVLYEYPLTESSISKGKQIIDSLISCIQENRTCVNALGLLAEHDQYTYYHSARVAAYSTTIALQMMLSDRNILEELALGCLLHDVGKSRIDHKIMEKTGPLSPAEWDVMRRHTQYGVEMTREAKLDVIPLEVILHHHERADGRGYPHGLGRHELLEEVTIAAFADIFDALTTKRPYQDTRTKYEALDFIKHHMIEQINKDAFRALVEVFQA